MLSILDYRAGNLTSVRRALDHLGIPCTITSSAATIDASHGIIFPGVGAAGTAMHHLQASGLDRVLHEQTQKGKPLLGICLGCQIVLESTPENATQTLGLLPGRCERFEESWTDAQGLPINIPHMGWNNVRLQAPCPLFTDISEQAAFYFVHSYYPVPAEAYVLGTTDYGQSFCSVLGQKGLWAVQFHPEKSGRPGLQLLANFYRYCQEVSGAQ